MVGWRTDRVGASGASPASFATVGTHRCRTGGVVNDGLKATLDRILASAQERAAYDELTNHGRSFKAPCVKCDDTGWMLLTSGRVTTQGGMEATASEAVPVARRCAAGCKPPTSGRKTTKAEPRARELKP